MTIEIINQDKDKKDQKPVEEEESEDEDKTMEEEAPIEIQNKPDWLGTQCIEFYQKTALNKEQATVLKTWLLQNDYTQSPSIEYVGEKENQKKK